MPREVFPTNSFDSTLAGLFRGHGWRRVGVVTGDTFEAATGFTDRLSEQVDGTVTRWSRGPVHGSAERVEQLVGPVRDFAPDVMVTAGGGSSHDTGKGVLALLARGGRLLEHCLDFRPPDDLRFVALPGEKVPLVTVPSTLSGSEANGSAGFTSYGSKGKRVLSDPSLVPRAVVLDPQLAAGVSPVVLLGSVMNALDHCVEALASRRRNPVSDFLVGAALRDLGSLDTEDDGTLGTKALASALTASSMTGTGMAGTWLGIAHAVGHVVGATYGVAHGAVHAAVAGACVRFNAEVASAAHRRAATSLGVDGGSDALADWLERRAHSWALPTRLGDLGVGREDLDELAQWVWRDHDTYFNPRRPRHPDEIVDLLAEAL